MDGRTEEEDKPSPERQSLARADVITTILPIPTSVQLISNVLFPTSRAGECAGDAGAANAETRHCAGRDCYRNPDEPKLNTI